MSEFVLDRGDPFVALSHLALYGLGAILETAGHDVRLSWTQRLRSRPQVTGDGLHDETIGNAVRAHAARLSADASWLSRDVSLKGRNRGLMSPRLTPFGRDTATWEHVQQQRHGVLDELTTLRRWLDLRLLAALGEPAYWSTNTKDELLQDDGASRWEMQPRNQGSEIVGSRLRKLATAVADREPAAIAAGLQGIRVRDEVGTDKPDSRTATGLASPGPTDNAVAWCALWGISQLPIAMRVANGRNGGTAATSGHLGRSRREWFYTPVWHHQWRPARLRTVLAAEQLRTAAAADLPVHPHDAPTPTAVEASRRWMAARGVVGVMRFPVERFGSESAPERRAMRGDPLVVQA